MTVELKTDDAESRSTGWLVWDLEQPEGSVSCLFKVFCMDEGRREKKM